MGKKRMEEGRDCMCVCVYVLGRLGNGRGGIGRAGEVGNRVSFLSAELVFPVCVHVCISQGILWVFSSLTVSSCSSFPS